MYVTKPTTQNGFLELLDNLDKPQKPRAQSAHLSIVVLTVTVMKLLLIKETLENLFTYLLIPHWEII